MSAGRAPDSLHLLVGPMFSGKTGRLIDLLEAEERAGRDVVTLRPAVGDRYSNTSIVSHDGRWRPAVAVSERHELRDALDCTSLVGLDEAQFLPAEASEVIVAAVRRGTRVIVAALDLDFRAHPFATTSILLEHATRVDRLVAVCGRCGAAATHTQRLIDGAPARLDDPILLVGGPERYAPRCSKCFYEERTAAGDAVSQQPDSTGRRAG